jgi:RsiW-degrading membrane proteinase PrsW (M82 family)
MERKHIAIKVHRPSRRELTFFFLAGVIMSVPMTVFVDQYLISALSWLPTVAVTIISAVIFAPFVEEFSKAFALFYRHGETQRSIMTLAICVGLGFAIVEFLEYVFLLGVPAIDRIPGIFFHPASTSITAYGIATRKTTRYYLLAVGLHFANNFLAVFLPGLTSIFVVAITVFIAYQLYNKTQEEIIEDDYAEVMELKT